MLIGICRYLCVKIEQMNLDLSGKNAVVCGSSQGIGLAAAIELAEMGANVTLVARNAEKLEAALDQLPMNRSGQTHSIAVADFANLHSVQTVAAELASRMTVHILVNNTGGPPAGPISTAKTEEFLSAFNNHLLANHSLVQAFVPGMKAAGFGRIVNVISTSVKIPLKGLGVSNTIRAAVANWSKTLSNEVAEFGITVNNVLPGATKTVRLESIIQNKSEKTGHQIDAVEQEMLDEIPMKRFGQPQELGAAIAFLCSPAAAYITGINVPVDGGRTGSL